MNIKELCSKLAYSEGGISNVKIGDIREVIKLLADEIGENKEVLELLYQYACYRMKKKSHE